MLCVLRTPTGATTIRPTLLHTPSGEPVLAATLEGSLTILARPAGKGHVAPDPDAGFVAEMLEDYRLAHPCHTRPGIWHLDTPRPPAGGRPRTP